MLPAPGEVRVRVHAASINPLDTRIREGYGKAVFSAMLPMTLGRDMSGVVDKLGPRTSLFTPGQAVFGAIQPYARHGTHSDYVNIHESYLAPKPSSLAHEEAAAVPFTALTAWKALVVDGGVRAGHRVLVLGGGSEVGRYAMQLAVAKGASVACTVGPEQEEEARDSGADAVADFRQVSMHPLSITPNSHSVLCECDFILLQRPEDIAQQLLAANPTRFDIALDTVGSVDAQRTAAETLRSGGMFVTLHGPAVKLLDKYGILLGGGVVAAELLSEKAHWRKYDVDLKWGVMRADGDALADIAKLIDARQIKLRQAMVVVDVHRKFEEGVYKGKVVLRLV
eukprot:jgi/Chlat1/7790/Chrsp66S07332